MCTTHVPGAKEYSYQIYCMDHLVGNLKSSCSLDPSFSRRARMGELYSPFSYRQRECLGYILSCFEK